MARSQKTKHKVKMRKTKSAKTGQNTTSATNTQTPEQKMETIQQITVPCSTQTEQKKIQPPSPTTTPVVWPGIRPTWPTWPRSKQGPRSTPPVPGMHSLNAFRPEQYVETSNPEATYQPTQPEALKHKQCL